MENSFPTGKQYLRGDNVYYLNFIMPRQILNYYSSRFVTGGLLIIEALLGTLFLMINEVAL